MDQTSSDGHTHSQQAALQKVKGGPVLHARHAGGAAAQGYRHAYDPAESPTDSGSSQPTDGGTAGNPPEATHVVAHVARMLQTHVQTILLIMGNVGCTMGYLVVTFSQQAPAVPQQQLDQRVLLTGRMPSTDLINTHTCIDSDVFVTAHIMINRCAFVEAFLLSNTNADSKKRTCKKRMLKTQDSTHPTPCAHGGNVSRCKSSTALPLHLQERSPAAQCCHSQTAIRPSPKSRQMGPKPYQGSLGPKSTIHA